jgi:hypothetical protein
VHFGEEVAAAGKVFQVEKLVLFEAMYRFHVALIGVGGWWDAYMLAVAEGFGKIALELAAVVRLPDQVAERNAVAMQMLLDAGSERCTEWRVSAAAEPAASSAGCRRDPWYRR